MVHNCKASVQRKKNITPKFSLSSNKAKHLKGGCDRIEQVLKIDLEKPEISQFIEKWLFYWTG